jgi:hypothetical protein
MTDAVADALSRACVSHSQGREFNFGAIPAGVTINDECQNTIDNAYHFLGINHPNLEAQAVMYCSGHANAGIAAQTRQEARTGFGSDSGAIST